MYVLCNHQEPVFVANEYSIIDRKKKDLEILCELAKSYNDDVLANRNGVVQKYGNKLDVNAQYNNLSIVAIYTD